MTWNRKVGAAVLLALLTAAPLHAQAPEKGKLLVATPDVSDPSYSETVVLLLHHDENGTIGVTINRPTWVDPQAVEPELGPLTGYSGNVYRGGPLGPTQLIFLVRSPPPGAFESPPILSGVYASGNLEVLSELVSHFGDDSRLRLYAGHSEWTDGQVEQEIANGQWVVVEGTAERVFSSDPGKLWEQMVSGGSELLVGTPSADDRPRRSRRSGMPGDDAVSRPRQAALSATSSGPR